MIKIIPAVYHITPFTKYIQTNMEQHGLEHIKKVFHIIAKVCSNSTCMNLVILHA